MTIVRKAAPGKGAGMEFVLSDDTLDRYGDIIEADGWVLTQFRKNPIALFGHSSNFPIGTWSDLRVEGGKLLGRLNLAARGTSQRIDELIALVEQGILRAVSVGFRPIESEPLNPKEPWAGLRYLKQELLETSLVSVPANPAALARARSLNVSDDTMGMVFGEHAARDLSAERRPVGEHAVKHSPIRGTKMKTLSQRVEGAQQALVQARDAYNDHVAEDDYDIEAADGLEAAMNDAEERLASLQRAEKRLASAGKEGAPAAPAVNRRPLGFPQQEVKASDLIVRAAVCHLLAHIGKQSLDQVLEERYPGHEATAVVTKADIPPATTTASGWASQLVETAMAEFLALLPATAIYPTLRSMGLGLSFGPNSGAIKIPFSSSTDALAGGFVLEGDPIPVGRMTLDSVTLTPHKFGIIVPMTREVMRYTNPAIEAVVRDELLARTAIKLDTLLLDANAGTATRPAGLRYNVSAAGSAYGGGDYKAFLEDMKTLLAPFDTANAGRKLALIMNPAQARSVRMMEGPNSSGFGWANQFLSDFRLVVSTTATAGTVIAVDAADFVTGTGDSPMFEASEQATIHMSDTPLPIVSGDPATADPVRSMFQTNSVALRMLMDVTWAMRRGGMVQWISGVSW